MSSSFSNIRGFTLIEVLLVVAVIGILASIVMVSLGGSSANTRDARRIGDLKNLQAAVNLFIQETGAPPGAAAGWWAQLNNSCAGLQPAPYSQLRPGYYAVLPEDPKTTDLASLTQCTSVNGIWYWYGRGRSLSGSSLVVTDGNRYVVCATLEKSTTPGYQTISNPWGGTTALNYCLGN